jgi:hypothetical protein
MPRVSGLVAMTSGVATAAAGGGDRTGSKIAPLSDFAEQASLLILEVRQRLWDDVLLCLAYYIRSVQGREKRKISLLHF